jgi:hypothetical protein
LNARIKGSEVIDTLKHSTDAKCNKHSPGCDFCDELHLDAIIVAVVTVVMETPLIEVVESSLIATVCLQKNAETSRPLRVVMQPLETTPMSSDVFRARGIVSLCFLACRDGCSRPCWGGGAQNFVAPWNLTLLLGIRCDRKPSMCNRLSLKFCEVGRLFQRPPSPLLPS